jgi:hypothetical protein
MVPASVYAVLPLTLQLLKKPGWAEKEEVHQKRRTRSLYNHHAWIEWRLESSLSAKRVFEDQSLPTVFPGPRHARKTR